jgi:hypothetical protein
MRLLCRSLRNSDQFFEYKARARLLSGLDLSGLSDDERKALFINIYNCLVIHGMIQGLHRSVFGALAGRLILYSTASYRVGGLVYSLDDIEHGLLRRNGVSPVPLATQQFSSARDPRLGYMVSKLDPRIHFALNCGAKGCPPIAVYTAGSLDKQLDRASKSFVRSTTVVDKVGLGDGAVFTVTLSMLFKWYRADFGETDVQVLRWIAPIVVEDVAVKLQEAIIVGSDPKAAKGRIKIVYSDYDWGENSK